MAASLAQFFRNLLILNRKKAVILLPYAIN